MSADAAGDSTGKGWLSLLPALTHIQANLEGDLSLQALAAVAGLSPSRFHRLFRQQVSETPKRYTQRLRLERAALRLWLHETTVLETALECGYQSHETFTRAFSRQFGVLPKQVKSQGIFALRSARARWPRLFPEDGDGECAQGYRLSKTRITTLKPMQLAFIRHVGPYEEVEDSLWRELKEWALRHGLEAERCLLGIAHDSPVVTAPDKLRFDAALQIQAPVEGDGRVGYQRLEGRTYAVTTHVGHYRTLASAYSALAKRITAIRDIHLVGPPAIEMYHENRIDAALSFNHTDLYIGVKRGSLPARFPAPA